MEIRGGGGIEENGDIVIVVILLQGKKERWALDKLMRLNYPD